MLIDNESMFDTFILLKFNIDCFPDLAMKTKLDNYDFDVAVRLNKEQYKYVGNYCIKYNCTKSQLIRNLIDVLAEIDANLSSNVSPT